MHSTLHPCSSNQFDTAWLESKLTSIQIMLISSHEIEHWFSNHTQRPLYQNPHRRMTLYLWEMRSVPQCSLDHPCSHSSSVSHSSHNVKITHFSTTYLFQLYCTYLHIMMGFNPDTFIRRLSNFQPHHTAHISVVSTTVHTITTAHNAAISIPVLIALHFLCMAKVCAHVRLMLVHITIDK